MSRSGATRWLSPLLNRFTTSNGRTSAYPLRPTRRPGYAAWLAYPTNGVDPMRNAFFATCLALSLTATVASSQELGSIPAGLSSEHITIRGVRLHYVKGGSGPLVLLVHGFGQNWAKWSGVMPALAKSFTVVAPDLPGLGDSDQPKSSYTGQDTSAYLYELAKNFSPGQPFNVIAHDIGVWNTYPMIAQHQSDIKSVVFMEAPIPDDSLYGFPAFARTGESLLWHFSFFAAKDDLAERLVSGKERLFFNHFIRIHSGDKPIPQSAIDYYADTYAKSGVLHAAFGYYQDLNKTIEQNRPFLSTKLGMPILAIGGGKSFGDGEGKQISQYGSRVESRVVAGCGHWLPEECEAPTDALLIEFLQRNGR